MAKLNLKSVSPVNEYSMEGNYIALREITGKAIVSLSLPKGEEKQISKAVTKGFGVKVPQVGASCLSTNNNYHLLGMQNDQLFILFDFDDVDPVALVSEILSDIGYYTDQSDGWVMLSISGSNCREALARICMINLASDVFKIGTVARTVMEHLATVILRTDEDEFLLLSPRSSAGSFLNMMETSIRYVS